MKADAQLSTNVAFLSCVEAVDRIRAGSTLMVGGFGITGIPEMLLGEMCRRPELGDFTIISNNFSLKSNLHKLFEQGKIRKGIGTYFTTSPMVVRAHREGRLDIELLPQGTFAEAIRLGGSGIPAFYTPTGAGTELARGKEARMYDGVECVLERTLTADVALIRAHKADKAGNIVYRKSARNFNPLMAAAARLTIAEVDDIVEVGELDSESIATPFIFVDIIVKRGDQTGYSTEN
ncbi:CoA transferase subunit A [Paenibacillus koleovorans]|uniref:CoA transferase subunit A n=1 Tax=Paenibacillus koleovorans TaxID=121608 RepID=UPI000FDB0ED4|nr:CoA transferase subunit A [Paenibacillus koleovorans]